jgi:hypothetical protein
MAARKPKAQATGPTFNDNFPLSEITVDKALQARLRMDQDAISEYADVIFTGGTLPAVDIFTVSVEGAPVNYLVDGFHRHAAFKKLGIMDLPANVHTGTYAEAMVFAAGANRGHGLRRSNGDKRRAVEMLFTLMATLGENWTDTRIAEATGVSSMFVGNMRKEIAADTAALPRNGANGKSVTIKPPAVPTAVLVPVEPSPEDEEDPLSPLPGYGETETPAKPVDNITKAATEPKMYPLGLALDKFANRVSEAATALRTLMEVYPTDEELAEALEANPGTLGLWTNTLGHFGGLVSRVNQIEAARDNPKSA